MWTKLVHVYETRLRCKNHVSAESLANLARLSSAGVFDYENGDQLEHHFYFGISFRCIPEIHPNLGLILSTGNYAQVWHNKSETLLQLATKFRLQMMRGANFVPN